MKTNQHVLTRILALVLICALVLPFVACGKQQDPQQDPNATPVAPKVTYTVKVESAGGIAMEGVGVYIYEDESLSELVWYDQTGADGTMTFSDVASGAYVAVLSEVPTGYRVEAQYPITGETTVITLASSQMSDDVLENLTYKPGDMVMDFTLTDGSGNSYTLSELLKEKKAVVLNFWYVQCAPCKAEFPFLQEAYEQYTGDIALLALNPINSADEVASFQAENGYTFPMLACENAWEKLFGVSAYPTTVIIDRFGNIALKHTGTIDAAKTFTDAFAFFTAEDYTAQVVEDIASLAIPVNEGTQDAPYQMSGTTTFEITLEPGREGFVELYRGKGMYLQIVGENKDFQVKIPNKTYTPDGKTVGFVINTGDNYTPLVFSVVNQSGVAQTFRMSLSHLPGTFNNPYSLPTGEFTAKVSAGNEQGVYYRGTAPEDGHFIIQCISAPAGVEYDFSLQSLDENRTILRNYRGDGTVDEETGYPTVTLPMKKGTDVMFSVGTLPDSSNSYPGGTFVFLMTFKAGELEEEEKEEKLDYTVTVTDTEGNPLKDVTVWLTKDAETFSGITDDAGKLALNLVKGTYEGTLSLPEGFTLENNAFTLTPEAPEAQLQLTAVADTRVDYTVTVTDPFEMPVEGAEILVIGVGSALTDAEGKVVFQLEPGDYTAMTGTLPADYTCSDMLTLTAEVTEGTLVLEFLPGTESNPIWLTEADATITNAATTWYATRFGGSIMVITGVPGFTVTYNGTAIADTDGSISLPVETMGPYAPMLFALTGDGEYRVTFTYPLGHQMNPAALTLGQNTVQRNAGDSDYYYTWTAEADGKLTITMDAAGQWVYCLSNQTAGVFGDTHWSDDQIPVISETLEVTAGDEIQLTVNTYDAADSFTTPAGTVIFEAAFAAAADEAVYTVTFDPNGGTLTGDATAQTMKGRLESMPADPVFEGYSFLGWFDAAEGGNAVTSETVFDADATVYAQWTNLEYRVTLDAQGGTLEGSQVLTTVDEKLPNLPAPIREGYTFNGWFDATEGGNKVTADTVFTANTTIYAQWTLIPVQPQTIPYTVNVVDGNGYPVTGGVVVTWQGSTVTNKTINNASGSVTADLKPGDYKVILTLTGAWAGYQYDAVTVTQDVPAATVQIAAPIASPPTLEETYVGPFAKVSAGATYVKLNSSQKNYAVYEGTTYCFFYYPITEAGKYTFTTSNGAVISSWGSNSFFMSKQDSDANNMVNVEFKDSHLHSGLAVYFAVEVTKDYPSTILLVAKAGEAEYTYQDAPYKAYVGTQTPKVAYQDGKPVAINANIFKLDMGGKQLTYVDMLTDKPVKGEDGFYHLGSEDGPILYVNLGENAPFRSMGTLVGAIGSYGTGLKKVFFDADGNVETTGDPDYPFRKEDYTDAMIAYCLHVDAETGVYPLTDDLIYMIQQGGDHLGWYKADNDNYLFAETAVEADPELIWMFAVCYLK